MTPVLELEPLVESQSNKHITINEAVEALERAQTLVVKSMVSGTVTLTATENRSGFLVLTGTLVAHSTLIVQEEQLKTFIVVDRTVRGAFDLKVKTPAGSDHTLVAGSVHLVNVATGGVVTSYLLAA